MHERWDLNTGILSGDTMLINAYQLFENYDGPVFKELAQLFTKTAIQVCEGQQYDIDFENREDVEIADYLKMIEFKTAVLVGASLQMGAIVAGAPEDSKKHFMNLDAYWELPFSFRMIIWMPLEIPKLLGNNSEVISLKIKNIFIFNRPSKGR